jgi:hypothetical protein
LAGGIAGSISAHSLSLRSLVAQAMAVGSTAMFRLPHSTPLNSDAGIGEGITTDSSDSTTLWIGSKGTATLNIRSDSASGTTSTDYEQRLPTKVYCEDLRSRTTNRVEKNTFSNFRNVQGSPFPTLAAKLNFRKLVWKGAPIERHNGGSGSSPVVRSGDRNGRFGRF